MVNSSRSLIAPQCLVRRWRDLESWITAGDLIDWTSPFNKVALGDLLSQRSDKIDLAGSFGDAQPITVHLTGEVSVRSRVAPYKGAVFAAYPGDIVLSKIDARNGAIGVVPDHITKAAVTSEFPVLTPNQDAVNGDYVRYVVRTGHFLDALKMRSAGTSGRKRISVDAFLSLEIPLPELAEQDELVSLYAMRCARAEYKLKQAEEIRTHGIREFETALGFASDFDGTTGGTGVARFAEMDRWSHDWVVQSRLAYSEDCVDVPYAELVSFADVRSGLTKSPSNRPTTRAHKYLSVANVKRWDLDLSHVKSIDVPDNELPKYLLKPGDVLVCEGGALDEVGRAALWEGDIEDCVHQNHVFRVRVETESVSPSYVVAVLNSNFGQRHFRMRAKRTTIASINHKDLTSFRMPLPPIDVQEELSRTLEQSRASAAWLSQLAANLRRRAWAGLTASIYS